MRERVNSIAGRGPVTLLATCLVDLFYPQVGVAVVKLLRRLGYSVEVPKGQTCCGMPLFNSGYREEARAVARRMIPIFGTARHVVVPSGSCAWMVKSEYPHLFPHDPEMTRQAEALSEKTFELSQFLVRVERIERVDSLFRGKVTYHDSCHLLRGLGVADAPRILLRSLPGVELVELPGSDQCCGFGGSFSVRMPEISDAILQQKIRNVKGTGADCLVACDAGCIMQISGGLSRQKASIRVRHLAEILTAGE